MVTPRANPDILACGGGTEMWMLLQVKRCVYSGSGGTVRKRKADIGKAKKDTKENCFYGYEWSSSRSSEKRLFLLS